MMKYFMVGLWLTVVALGSTFGAATFMAGRKDGAGAAPPPPPLQSQKTRVLNVPMIRDGVVGGYVSVQFVYTTEAKAGAKEELTISPEMFMLDDAFRLIYADDSFDFRHLERYDLGKLTKTLIEDTNAKMGIPIVKDILISDMNYTPKDQVNHAAPEPANGGGEEAAPPETQHVSSPGQGNQQHEAANKEAE